MQYTRESGTRFDLNFRNLGKELNRVNFDISDNIVSLYIFYKIKIYNTVNVRKSSFTSKR